MANMSKEKNKMPEQDPKLRASNFDEVALGYTPDLAVDEAERCLMCKNKPCIAGCPVLIDIPGFIKKVQDSDLKLHIRLLPVPVRCPQFAGGFVRRKDSVRSFVRGEKMVSL